MKQRFLLAKEWVAQMGEYLREVTSQPFDFSTKTGHQDIVTAHDKKVEQFFRDSILSYFPQDEIVGEEFSGKTGTGSGIRWYIDPIDGTTNFVRGLNQSAISVGLYRDGTAEYAVVLDPFKNELFSAQRGGGAFLNGAPIHVSDRPLSKGIFGMGTAIYNREFEEQTMAVTAQLFARSCDFRRMGAAALDLCYTAAGRYDAFFEFSLAPWDYAAASLVIREAGGRICTMEGEELPLTRCGIWAANPVNFPILKELSF